MDSRTVSPQDRVFELINGFRAAQVVALAAELGLPELIAQAPRSAEEAAAITETHAPSMLRLLRALTVVGIFTEDGNGSFHPTELSSCLVPGQRPYAQARMLLRESYLAFTELGHSIRTGRPSFELVHGKSRWAYLAEDPDSAARFNDAMAVQAAMDGRGLGEASDLSTVSTIVDVGGGRAALMAEVLQRHRHIQGVVLDLAAGLQGASVQLEAAGVADRCQLVEGSFFEAVPSGGDAYLLRNILHDWDDENAARIASVVAAAMAPGARLFVIERLRPSRYGSSPSDLYIAFTDLQMLVLFGGRERTEDELAQMLRPLGVDLTRKAPLPSGTFLVEGWKR